MKKTLLGTLIVLCIFACDKNPIFVGNKEFLTLSYSNPQGTPNVSATPLDQSPFLEVDNIFAQNLGNGTVQVIAEGIRVQSNSDNFEVTKIKVYEKDRNKFERQDEFTNARTSNKNDLAAVLVLDMSKSLEGLVNDLKEYAKSFVDEVVGSTNNSKVAVVFFSGKNDISTTAFYDKSNAQTLKTEIDNFINYQPRTALFQATVTGINLLNNLAFEGEKALVVFTDGGDNDSDNPSSLKSQINASEHLRISIGLKGEDFNKNDIDAIASSNANSKVVNKENELESVFDEVGKLIVSVYRVVYDRSDQLLEEEIQIKFEFEVDKIK